MPTRCVNEANSAAALATCASFFTKSCEVHHFQVVGSSENRGSESKPMNSIDHFYSSDDLRHRHDLMVELYRLEQAQEVAHARASAAELERLQCQQQKIREALARLAA
jgi:hypothetical protein